MKIVLMTFLLIGLYILEVNCRYYGRRKPRKGVCPKPLACYPVAKYHKRCLHDFDCDEDHKCCPDIGGHHICQKIRNIRRYPGCPSPESLTCLVEEGRHMDCDRHSDCRPNFQCCSDEFGHRICVPSADKENKTKGRKTKGMKTKGRRTKGRENKRKPGRCTQPRPGAVSCDRQCENDSDCSGFMKCCHNGCGRECKDPWRPRRRMYYTYG